MVEGPHHPSALGQEIDGKGPGDGGDAWMALDGLGQGSGDFAARGIALGVEEDDAEVKWFKDGVEIVPDGKRLRRRA